MGEKSESTNIKIFQISKIYVKESSKFTRKSSLKIRKQNSKYLEIVSLKDQKNDYLKMIKITVGNGGQ